MNLIKKLNKWIRHKLSDMWILSLHQTQMTFFVIKKGMIGIILTDLDNGLSLLRFFNLDKVMLLSC